jgi:hypothetical protein
MPLVIKKYKSGFRVCEEDNPKICYSKKPLTEKKAKKQELAIRLSKLRKEGRI